LSPSRPPEDRFFEKVIEDGDCWRWTGALDKGYGKFWARDAAGIWRNRPAHRWAYEFLITDIPEGLVLDHLCRNPPCVNPWHMDPVPQGVNVRRGVGVGMLPFEYCKSGLHRMDESSSISVSKKTGKIDRHCRPCRSAWMRRWRAARVDSNPGSD
jgi:hypothetical protein